MCTLTWLDTEDGYTVFFNRDERKTRPVALPPAVHRVEGVAYIAPIDPEGGGSWIAVNELGLTLVILNNYTVPGSPPAPRDRRSRGLLLTDLAPSRGALEAEERVFAVSPARYGPFILGIHAADGTATQVVWDGEALRRGTPPGAAAPLTTSSIDAEAVRRRRERTFDAMVAVNSGVDEKLLEMFHMSDEPDVPAYGVCMDRPLSATVSITQVRVRAAAVTMLYREVAAADRRFGEPVRVDWPRAGAVLREGP